MCSLTGQVRKAAPQRIPLAKCVDPLPSGITTPCKKSQCSKLRARRNLDRNVLMSDRGGSELITAFRLDSEPMFEAINRRRPVEMEDLVREDFTDIVLDFCGPSLDR